MQSGDRTNVSADQDSPKSASNVYVMELKLESYAINVHTNQIQSLTKEQIHVNVNEDLLKLEKYVSQLAEMLQIKTHRLVALEHISIATINLVWHVQLAV
jgi:hypothetical protein